MDIKAIKSQAEKEIEEDLMTKTKRYFAWVAFKRGRPIGGFWPSKKSIYNDGWEGRDARFCEIIERNPRRISK